jgi:hypothetical protein
MDKLDVLKKVIANGGCIANGVLQRLQVVVIVDADANGPVSAHVRRFGGAFNRLV